jgi:hypothetical protein
MLIGMSLVIAVSVVCMGSAPARAQSVAELRPDDPAQFDDFGYSVAISDGRIAVGSPYSIENLPELKVAGAAYIFIRSPDGWEQEAKLNPSVSHVEDNFGYSVDLEGDVAVVGAPTDPNNQYGEGRVFIFRRSGSNWIEEAMLTYENSFKFGKCVALSGNTVVVASKSEVWVYVKQFPNWKLQERIRPQRRWITITSLALEEDHLLIGSPQGVFPYQRNENDWNAEGPFDLHDSEPNGMFGCQVSMSGRWAVVGAVDAEDGFPDRSYGAVFIFKRTGGSWVRHSKIARHTPYDPLAFACSVDIDTDYFIVGAYTHPEVFIFRLVGDEWMEVGEGYRQTGVEHTDRFGNSVAVDRGGLLREGAFVVGAPTFSPDNTGAAYVIEGLIPPAFSQIDPDRFTLLAKLLIGVAEGGKGWIWVPGEGPIPIDPEPFKFMKLLSPTERDVVIGLAVRELAAMTSDKKIRSELEAAGNRVMSDAINKLKAEQPR